MTKVAVLTIMYEDGDERCSAYIKTTQCFHLGDSLHDRIKGFLLSYVKHDRFEYDVGCYFPDDVDEWLSEREDEFLWIGEFERAQLDIVDIL